MLLWFSSSVFFRSVFSHVSTSSLFVSDLAWWSLRVRCHCSVRLLFNLIALPALSVSGESLEMNGSFCGCSDFHFKTGWQPGMCVWASFSRLSMSVNHFCILTHRRLFPGPQGAPMKEDCEHISMPSAKFRTCAAGFHESFLRSDVVTKGCRVTRQRERPIQSKRKFCTLAAFSLERINAKGFGFVTFATAEQAAAAIAATSDDYYIDERKVRVK